MIPDYSLIPSATLETLQAWVKQARPLNAFCEALIRNDLKECFACADENNLRAMFHVVAWLYNEAPLQSWGSPEALHRWPKIVKRDAV